MTPVILLTGAGRLGGLPSKEWYNPTIMGNAGPRDEPPGDERLDILFAVSPTNARSVYMPFYFLHLASFIEKVGLTCEIVNPHFHSIEENAAHIIAEIARLKPRWVGLACFVTDYTCVAGLAADIKKACPAVRIMVGNAQPSVNPGDFLHEGSPFDIVVRGEGEQTLREFLQFERAGKSTEDVAGIAYFKDGRIVMTPSRPLMDLSLCAPPAYHKIDVAWYARPNKYLLRRIPASCAVIFTGRGCPFECGFCASNAVWKANTSDATRAPKARWRPIEDVIAELRIFQERYGFDFFYILDDVFGLTEKDIKVFCAAYKKSGLTMLWGAETRVNCVRNKEILEVLQDAGCIQLDFGIESGSPKMLRIVNKGITVEQTEKAFALCNETGMRTFANVLVNMPEEDEEDLEMTHKVLRKIKPSYISIGVTQPYPGTEFYMRFNQSIPKEDYEKLSRVLPPEQFRLAKHKLDLQKLLKGMMWTYQIDTFLEKGLFDARWNYWKKIITSPRRLSYLRYFLRDLVRTPVHYVVREHFPPEAMGFARRLVRSIGSV